MLDCYEIEQTTQEADWNTASERPPRVGEYVLYRTTRYQAMGRIDYSGRWHTVSGQPERAAVLDWKKLGA
jgi:hypothetical protein